MSSRLLSRSLLALALLHSASGCSWAFMTRAEVPVAVPNYPVECTSSTAAPVLDAICSGYFVVNGLVLAGYKSCDSASFGEFCISSSAKTTGIVTSVGLAALCAFSSGSGFGTASKCSEVKTANALCITGDEAACRRLNPAWSPRLNLPAPPPGRPAPGPLPPAGAGCAKDTDCKGDRVCERGACVEPSDMPTTAPGR